jgi:Domain of unknown function (DUF4149)
MIRYYTKSPWKHILYCLLLGFWAASFVWVGAVTVPALFASMHKTQAVEVAITLFRAQGVIGFLTLTLIALCFIAHTVLASRLEVVCLTLAFFVGCVLHFWVIPTLLQTRNAFADASLWHTLSSVLFVVQGVLVLVSLVRRLGTPETIPS